MEALIHIALGLSIAFSDKELVEKIIQADQSKISLNCLSLMVANHCLGKGVVASSVPRPHSCIHPPKNILGFQKESWVSKIPRVTSWLNKITLADRRGQTGGEREQSRL